MQTISSYIKPVFCQTSSRPLINKHTENPAWFLILSAKNAFVAKVVRQDFIFFHESFHIQKDNKAMK